EITEQAVFEDYDAVRAAMSALKSAGVAFAIDDLGAGYSGLRTWSELDPEFIKIDQYFASRIDQDPLKGEFVRAIVEMACATRSAVICEGVETEGEARELLLAGADFVQGYWLTRPAEGPQPVVSEEATALLRPKGRPGVDGLARSLVSGQQAIEPEVLVRDVAAMFHLEPQLEALAVVDDHGEPLGLVSRRDLLSTLSLPLRTELYAKRPVRELMNGAPLLIDVGLELAQVLRRVSRARHQGASDHFIVTEDARYVGIGRAADLLDQLRLQRAAGERHANPLSSLPTAVPLYEFVDRLGRRHLPFVLLRVDLQGLRPYNDLYGYRRGDRVLQSLCRLLREDGTQFDFVAHLGADDFVLVSVNREWRPMIDKVVARFADTLPEHYPSAAVDAGFTRVPDRRGHTREFPLMRVRWWALHCSSSSSVRGESSIDTLERLVRERAPEQLYSYVEAESEVDDVDIIALEDDDAQIAASARTRAGD
ncbi:MAG: GGDEF domain-containing protein, partial [Pseudomonadota bacterium]